MTSGMSHIRARLGGLRGLRGLRPRASDRDPRGPVPPVSGSGASGKPCSCRACPRVARTALLLLAGRQPSARPGRAQRRVRPARVPTVAGKSGVSGRLSACRETRLAGEAGLPGETSLGRGTRCSREARIPPGPRSPTVRRLRSRPRAPVLRAPVPRVPVRRVPVRRVRCGESRCRRSRRCLGSVGRLEESPWPGLGAFAARGRPLSSSPERAGVPARAVVHSPASWASSSTAQVWVAVASADGSLTASSGVPGLGCLGAGPGRQSGPPGRTDRAERRRVPRRELARRVHRVGRSGCGRKSPHRAASAGARGPEGAGAPQ